MPAICARCKNELTEKEKDIGIPICQDCIGLLIDSDKLRPDERKIEKEVDNFSRFILSSGNLFNLDDITIIQCTFNIFMSEIVNLENKNPIISEKILKDSIRFIQEELKRMDEKKKKSSDNPKARMSIFDELIKKGTKMGNGHKDRLDEIIDKDSSDKKKEKETEKG